MKRTEQDKIDNSVYDKLQVPKENKAIYLGWNPKGNHWVYEMFKKYKTQK